jgi:hypothetical protein
MKLSLRQIVLLPMLACACLVTGLGAQDDFFNTIEVDVDAASPSSAYSLVGWVSEKLAYGTQNPGPLFSRDQAQINRIETSLFLQVDAELASNSSLRVSGRAYHDEVYRFFDDTGYQPAEINELRNRYEVRDLYIESRLDNGLYVRFGKQILAWGLSEYLRVTDLVNIEDQYNFGQQDLENLRLQVPALLLSANAGDWLLDGVVTWQAGNDQIAPRGNEFDPFARLRNAGFGITLSEPEQDHELYLRASRQSSFGDIQLVLGDYNDNALSLQGIDDTQAIGPQLSYAQNRMQAAGVAANHARGNWLLFGEAGLHLNKAVRPAFDLLPGAANGWAEKNQLLTVLGAEYSGYRNLLLSAELNNIHTRSHDPLMFGERDQLSFGIRAYWTALNERLQILGVVNELANDAGRLTRLSLNYNWSDHLDLGLMLVNYSFRDSSFFYDYSNNDVLQLQLRYNFQR